MKSKKKYIVFASLVLALSAAVYINWQLSGAKTPKSAKELFSLESSSDADKSEAEKNVEELLKTFTIQDSIESIVKAKGFSECLCYISNQGVSVIVPKSQLDDTSVLIIDDAVVTHYEVDYDDISVIGA